MSRLTRSLPILLAAVFAASAARGEGDVKAAPASSRLRWDLGTRVGYAASWNTAQSYLGLGTGLAGGVTFPVPIHVEIGAVYHAGSTVSAANRSLVYRSREWSVLAHAGVGYELTMLARRLVVRPQVIVGCPFLAESVQLGGATRRGLEPMLTLGPGVGLLVRFGDLHAGVDARALFVPSRVAAPIAGIYAVFGLER